MSRIRPFVAIDWGTSNRRIYAIDGDGIVSQSERDDRGALAMRDADYVAEIQSIAGRFGNVPIVCAGMVGSRIGWSEVPYAVVPGGLSDLACGARQVSHDVFIIPGMSRLDRYRADVMRGEEVQFLGAAASGMVPATALLCQPGTHAKWATLRDGQMIDFTTAMTGEMFALLRDHSLLAEPLANAVSDGAAFRAGVAAAQRDDLLAALFGIRAASLLRPDDLVDGASFASGLLIGTDVTARLGETSDIVYLLAEPVLAPLYASAIEAQGSKCIAVDSHAAFVAGIVSVWEQLQ